MSNGQFLLSVIAVIGAIVIVLVEGRRAIGVASAAAAIALAPSAIVVGGPRGAVIPVLGAASAGLAVRLARLAAERLPRVSGLDPLVPVIAPPDGLFGPRSVRMAAVACGLPAASWISFNVQLVGGASARGVVFAAVYTWIAGITRTLLGRTIEDLAVGTSVIALAAGVAWTTQGGPATSTDAGVLAGLAPLSGAVAGWLTGRHRRGVPPERAAEGATEGMR